MKFNQIYQKISNFWYEQISTRLFPRQKWLKQLIPRRYEEIGTLIELLNYECLIYYWENEGENRLRKTYESFHVDSEDLNNAGWTDEMIIEQHDKNLVIYNELREAYMWARERKVLRGDIEGLIRKHYNTKEFKKVYNWFEAMERYTIEQDAIHLPIIIKHRSEMWS